MTGQLSNLIQTIGERYYMSIIKMDTIKKL